MEQLLAVNGELTEPVGPTQPDRPSVVNDATRSAPGAEAAEAVAPIEIANIYREHADFLWRSLQHLGIHDADLEDVMQEVLMVAHRRRQSYDSTCRITTWLFGICLRVASQDRRRAHRRWEQSAAELPEQPSGITPESQFVRREAAQRLEAILTQLSLEQRATFVMFEIEGESCQTIAELFAVPLGTVYSRLHSARVAIQEHLERERRLKLKAGRP